MDDTTGWHNLESSLIAFHELVRGSGRSLTIEKTTTTTTTTTATTTTTTTAATTTPMNGDSVGTSTGGGAGSSAGSSGDSSTSTADSGMIELTDGVFDILITQASRHTRWSAVPIYNSNPIPALALAPNLPQSHLDHASISTHQVVCCPYP